jgi:O-succinylbenzoate synthase
MKKTDMDKLNEYIKTQISRDFSLSDNKAMDILYECMQDLKRNGLDVNKENIPDNEKPQKQLGYVDKKLRERIMFYQSTMKKQKKTSKPSIRNKEESPIRI